MNQPSFDWQNYIALMEQLLAVPLTDERRKELEFQLTRIAAMAEPLMAFPLPDRQETAGVYSL
ncbi:oxalurate catabolism protein HpxX [Cedecea sp. P7760]|uniref:oxalurate catabolism protein HpxX n=1 Tax=Cedecea sp. P7760 TaxID=2726983 RepID=UPI0015A3BD31|nr:oxalurate catabolism protein HpxX [Cedecea sp. P7760]NWC63341.1 oxalurate catabolism protein HpxX [Cedecea sp. P7760]